MRSLFSILAVFFLSFGTFCYGEESQNWPHWRGHGGNSVSLTAKPPTKWSATENIKWKVEIPGRGSGSPVIWGEKVFVVSAVGGSTSGSGKSKGGKGGKGKGGKSGKGKGGSNETSALSFQLFCFDRSSGALLWKQVATEAAPHEGTHSTNGFASASPCTDGEHVYAHFGSRGLFCYTMDGDLVWQRTDFPPMQTRATFGEGSSPTLAGDKIIVPWDHEGPSALYALNKKSGETVWEVSRDEPTCWATPLVVDEKVIMNGERKARAYDLATGQELWQCGGQTQRPVASPVHVDGITIIGSGFRGSFIGAINLVGQGDIEGTDDVIWSTKDDTPDIASPLLSEGRLYFYKGKTGILSCLDAATGKVHFGPERIDGVSSTYASPVA
ncbi:MAG: PQQ-binding-like beta-propeller repeat protein, partial [Verrucomicrobiota bacterium]